MRINGSDIYLRAIRLCREWQKFTPEELERMEKHLEVLSDREELIGCLDDYSYFFADWSLIVNESVLEMIEKKQKLKIFCYVAHNITGDFQ